VAEAPAGTSRRYKVTAKRVVKPWRVDGAQLLDELLSLGKARPRGPPSSARISRGRRTTNFHREEQDET
jgi:hypothetical protein